MATRGKVKTSRARETSHNGGPACRVARLSRENDDSTRARGPLFTLDDRVAVQRHDRLLIKGQTRRMTLLKRAATSVFGTAAAMTRLSDGRPATPSHMLHTLSPGGDASRVPS